MSSVSDPGVRAQGRTLQESEAAARGKVRGGAVSQIHPPDGGRALLLSQQESKNLSLYILMWISTLLPGDSQRYQAREPAAGRQG